MERAVLCFLENAMKFNRPSPVTDSPRNSAADYCKQGQAHSQAGAFQRGLQAFDQAIALNPNDHSVHNHRGNVLCQLKRYAEALAAYDRAIALCPSYHKAWFNRGQLLTAMGAYGNALESYAQAIRFKPDPMYLHAQENIWLQKKLVKA